MSRRIDVLVLDCLYGHQEEDVTSGPAPDLSVVDP
jgi:hypothetical protein